jgi:chemotaxis signal transduction protein
VQKFQAFKMVATVEILFLAAQSPTVVVAVAVSTQKLAVPVAQVAEVHKIQPMSQELLLKVMRAQPVNPLPHVPQLVVVVARDP